MYCLSIFAKWSGFQNRIYFKRRHCALAPRWTSCLASIIYILLDPLFLLLFHHEKAPKGGKKVEEDTVLYPPPPPPRVFIRETAWRRRLRVLKFDKRLSLMGRSRSRRQGFFSFFCAGFNAHSHKLGTIFYFSQFKWEKGCNIPPLIKKCPGPCHFPTLKYCPKLVGERKERKRGGKSKLPKYSEKTPPSSRLKEETLDRGTPVRAIKTVQKNSELLSGKRGGGEGEKKDLVTEKGGGGEGGSGKNTISRHPFVPLPR